MTLFGFINQFTRYSLAYLLQVQGKEDEEVRFRAFIEDISESVSPSYNENKYIGRYETFYT